MTSSVCDGNYIDESVAAVYDRIAEQYRTFPHHCRHTAEARQHDHRAKRSVRRYETSESETERVVAALVTLASRMGDEERAAILQVEARNGDPADDDEACRIVREHGFSPDRLVALRGLARSRDIELETVLRAALRGSLRDIVKLPPAAPAP